MNRSRCPPWRRHRHVAKYEPKLARDRWRRRRARAAYLARRQRRWRSSSEIRPAQHNAASKPPMVQITGQNARIAALSMITASNRDYPRSTPSRRRYSPDIALDPPDGLLIDVTGAAHLHGWQPRSPAPLTDEAANARF